MLVTLDVCIGAGITDQRGAESFRSYMNRYSQRLSEGSSKHLSSTQPGGGLSLYILLLLKLANLPVQKTNSLPRGSRKMLKYLSRLLGQQQTTNDNLQKTDTYRQITRPVIVEPDLSQGYNYTEATYIRETGRNLSTRLIEHKGATRNGDVTINHIAEHYSTSFSGFSLLLRERTLVAATPRQNDCACARLSISGHFFSQTFQSDQSLPRTLGYILCAACGSVVLLHTAHIFDHFVVIEIAFMDNQAQISETISRLDSEKLS